MSGADDPLEERQLAWHEVPPEMQDRIGPRLPDGHAVWRVPCRSRGGLFRRDRLVIEYWWLDESGDLVEAFWFKD